MSIERPDLSGVEPEIREYIEYLEAQLGRKSAARKTPEEEAPEIPLVPSEPPTTIQLISMTASGVTKRTFRHLYTRQRRGGMGIFDLDTNEKEAPSILVPVEPGQRLLLFTNMGRVFRLPVETIPEGEIRSRGQLVTGKLGLNDDETIAAALPDRARGSVVMLSERGMVRLLRHHVFGEYMKPGTQVMDPRSFGPLVSVCRTPGDAELFIATRQGKAIRFSEKLVPVQGGAGIRLDSGDQGAAVTGVYPDSLVFLLSSDGRGTIRSMEGFNPNKSAGGGGKIAMTTDHLAAAFTINLNDDIFVISRLSKIIRFMAAEVPVKEGVVQGVNCVSLRADEVTAASTSAV
jgi:DNA gyrase subunit A